MANDGRTRIGNLRDATDQHGKHTCVRAGTDGVNVYVFFTGATGAGDLLYVKSTNNGSTFGAEQTISSAREFNSCSVWYDRWTIGDTTGNIVHIVVCDVTNKDAVYFSLDVSSDTAGTNNDVVALNGSDLAPNSDVDGLPCICKAQNGNIFLSCTFGASEVTLAQGIQITKSTDSGAVWTNITTPASGFDIASVYTDDEDTCWMSPLKTDDDLFMVLYDSSLTEIHYTIYDEVADTWSTPIKILDSFTINTGIFDAVSLCTRKDTGDIYMAAVGSTGGTGYSIFYKFGDSSRDWDLQTILSDTSDNSQDIDAISQSVHGIQFDETNNVLCLWSIIGGGAARKDLAARFSSDDGVTWSDLVRPTFNWQSSDFVHIDCPPIMFTTAEGWYAMMLDEGGNDIEAPKFPIEYNTVSGVVKDNAGSTVASAVVKLFSHGKFLNIGGVPTAKYETYHGSCIADGIGNYKCHVYSGRNRFIEAYYAVSQENELDELTHPDSADIPADATLTSTATGTVHVNKFTGLTNGDKYRWVAVKVSASAEADRATNIRIKVYDDNAGVPNNLLGESGAVSLKENGFQWFQLAADVIVPSDGILWVGYELSATASMSTVTVASGLEKTIAHTFGAGPDPFGTATNATKNRVLIIAKSPDIVQTQVDASLTVAKD